MCVPFMGKCCGCGCGCIYICGCVYMESQYNSSLISPLTPTLSLLCVGSETEKKTLNHPVELESNPNSNHNHSNINFNTAGSIAVATPVEETATGTSKQVV